MNDEPPDSKLSRAVSSIEVSISGGTTEECAYSPITSSARSVGASSRPTSVGPVRIGEPADSIIAVAHTVKPS